MNTVQGLQFVKRRYIETIIVTLSVFVMIITGFTNAAAAEKSTEQLLDEARAAAKSVAVQEVKGIVDGKDKAVLLDIRDMKEFVVDHIPGAENLSRAVGLSPRVLEHHLHKIAPDKSARIIVYCEFETRSPLAVKAMNEIGYSNAAYMKGGLKAWKDSGYPLAKK